ncbi:hypothetical protein PTTG_04894 [Puccinia triticina 1-1 BBBD Race 1]|uniref:NodB homology domain-containing protein n=2 Tax=Puccinia triticina TaxID=208348 RepID=A0A180GST5_PUCT1|nr:uncharacterized protein PtA15_11A437 [Puccinia triticina]OAV95866.1 hypothetical protein PTTG_04894 [Puccinia triticina 1-1 BBBD Race 1]WAQ89746.1 hypothetical protein PtA15_11A437 [Puccinia triticina]WAR59795.1 hypothetical protein PtB15_11B436 [Puccinia triticina]
MVSTSLILLVLLVQRHHSSFASSDSAGNSKYLNANSDFRIPSISTNSNHDYSLHLSNLTARAGPAVPIYNTCSTPGSFSLTFDDGPSQFSSRLDANLAAANFKASYFINGNNIGCIYDFADLLIDRFGKGHLIASHTWSHVHLNQGSYQQISQQLELLENAMIKILGVKPLYFRPPFGEFNDLVLQVLQDRGYKGLILWSQDSKDSLASPPSSSEIIESYRFYPEQTNVLNHETTALMVDEVIPGVVPILKEKGFNLQTSPDCLGLGSNPSDWYVSVQQPGSRDESWTCNGTPTSESYV